MTVSGDYRFRLRILHARFFTVGTLVRFGSVFGLGDAFLEFFFEDFLEEFLSFGAKEVIDVVEGASVLGGVHDLVAFGEQGIQYFHVNKGLSLHCTNAQ